MDETQLSTLIPNNSPKAILEEVTTIIDLIPLELDVGEISYVFYKVSNLYRGKYPGYRACNTEYHDLRHVNETFLAMARLIHGAILESKKFTDRQIMLGLIASLLHDAGYIQEVNDTIGTGSKYTADHVQRSMDFLERHGSKLKLSKDEIKDGRDIILCTDLAADISTIQFSAREIELLGKILGVADLFAQMADRTYLEKLRFLYYEFKEAGIGGYTSEEDLLRKTVNFYDFVQERIKTALGSVDRFMYLHFVSRWNIHADLYHEAIEKQKRFLVDILKLPDFNPKQHFSRINAVEKLSKEYNLSIDYSMDDSAVRNDQDT